MSIRFKPDPYSCYVISFGIATVVYLPGWSGLYPPLQSALIALLISTIAIHFWLSRRLQKKMTAVPRAPDPSDNSPVYVTGFIYVLWVAEFVYEGGVPLFKIIFDIPYNYRLFGIPSLHVFVVTFSSFYTIYLLQLYLARRTRMLLLLYCVNLVAAVLIYSRAMLFLNLWGSLVVYLTCTGGLTRRQAITGVAGVLVLLYGFGVLGSLRVSRIAGQPYNNENFLQTGDATESFRTSIIPDEYFWAYMYISSPLANFTQNIRLQKPDPPTPTNLAALINGEILPDFLSKRIAKFLDLRPRTESRIPGPFNVSTIYSRAYSYAGWTGILLLAGFLISFPVAFVKILPYNSRFFLTGWAILCAMYFFSMYDNPFRFTGLSFQLFYPVALHWIDKKWKRLPGVF